jgi:hypothetical protein
MARFPGSNEALPPDNEAQWYGGSLPPGSRLSARHVYPTVLAEGSTSAAREPESLGRRVGGRTQSRILRASAFVSIREERSGRRDQSTASGAAHRLSTRPGGPDPGVHCPAPTVRCFVDRAFSPSYAICDLRSAGPNQSTRQGEIGPTGIGHQRRRFHSAAIDCSDRVDRLAG